MFGIMSHLAILLVVLGFLCPVTFQQTLPPKAVNPERIQLLKDALSWMTFKKDGSLASDTDLEPFFEVLKDKYLRSKYYKTMIIAFMRGVLPKLTLKENAPCDLAYTLEYRDSHNNSVTDGQLKRFILGSYDKRHEATRQFCDYREGLVCNQQTSKCECPLGSKMGPISQGSAVKRCLAQENEVCTLIDLDHDPSSNYGALKKLLPEMVFNLEKPLSCMMGTQCRFKSANPTTPLCYAVNGGPWDKGRWDIDFGEECVLGLYGDTGQCKIIPRGSTEDVFGTVFQGYTCFNFGPRSLPKSPHFGLCARELGSYGITRSITRNSLCGWHWDLQMIGFVSPATTPLRGKMLFNYYYNYSEKFEVTFGPSIFTDTLIVYHAGGRCNIEKTEKLLELWKFYKRLEDTPPQGKDYAATEAELEAKLKEVEDLIVDKKRWFCRVRSDFCSNSEADHALRCVLNSTKDREGYDGRCEVIPESEDVTFSWAKSFFQYREHVRKTSYDLYWEEENYRKDIYEPDLECDPKLGPPPGSQGAAPSTDTFVLEGGYCPPDRGCYQDYGKHTGIYEQIGCNLKENNKPKQWLNCQDLSENRKYDSCEKQQLDTKFKEELRTVTSYSGLQRGDQCNREFQEKFRKVIESGGWLNKDNKYKRLIELFNIKNNIGGKKLCDRTKLLECSKNSGTCECLPNTKPREVILDSGMKIYSDYCFVESGNCIEWDGLRDIFSQSSEAEKYEIRRHYGQRVGDPQQFFSCEDKNWCFFINEDECTTENTGSTGYNGTEPVMTTTTVKSSTTTENVRPVGPVGSVTPVTDESNLMCEGDKCGWQDAGEAEKTIHVLIKMIILIKSLTIWLNM